MATSRRRVGIIMPLATQQGGAESLLQQFLHRRSERLEIVCAFLQDGPLVQEARALGYDARVFPITQLRHPWNVAKTILSLRSWITQEELSVVFSWMLKAHLYASPAATLLATRTMWFQHGIPAKNWMNRIGTLLPVSAVFCCSDHAKFAQDSLFPRRQSFVCHPGVEFPDDQEFSQSEARSRLGLPAGVPVIGMVARWERWKGAHVFVEAARKVAAADPSAISFLVGGPHPYDLRYAEELRTLVKDSGLGERFILAGQRPSSEVPLWHASANLIVHPATAAEPFGMAVVEAMGKRKVVIASNLGGPSEIIEDKISGLLIPPSEPGVLAEAILRLLSDADLRSRIADHAYLRGRSFSLENFALRFEQLLLNAAGPQSDRPLPAISQPGVNL